MANNDRPDLLIKSQAPAYKRMSFGRYMRKFGISYAMIAPFTLLFFLFTVLPVVTSILFSFTNDDMLNIWNLRWVGWSNFTQMVVGDDVFPIAVRNTLVFALLTGATGYFLSLMLAWFINELPRRL
ncbi:MAG: sugar ABC transporter permease, partial [Clostridia bacterium]|nr:sugar ABC transporter permease [Clostridia bacterium]